MNQSIHNPQTRQATVEIDSFFIKFRIDSFDSYFGTSFIRILRGDGFCQPRAHRPQFIGYESIRNSKDDG